MSREASTLPTSQQIAQHPELARLHALAQQIELTIRTLVATHPGLDGDDAPYWARPAGAQLEVPRRLTQDAADLAKNLQRYITGITRSPAEDEPDLHDLPF